MGFQCSQNVCFDIADVCHKPWRPVVKLDEFGTVVNGSLKELKSLALEGAIFRIKLYRPEGPYLMNVDNVNQHGRHLCAESLWHVSDNGTHIR